MEKNLLSQFAEASLTSLAESFNAQVAENGGYPPTQNGDIRSLFLLFSLMAMQN